MPAGAIIFACRVKNISVAKRSEIIRKTFWWEVEAWTAPSVQYPPDEKVAAICNQCPWQRAWLRQKEAVVHAYAAR
jgi:hypothetical protein